MTHLVAAPRIRKASRLVSTLVVLAPFIAAACGGDDDSTAQGGSSGQAQAGKGGSGQAQAGQGGAGGRGGSAGANAGDTNAGGSDACVPVGGNGFVGNAKGVAEPLGDACDQLKCPSSIVAAAEQTLERCTNTFPPRISYGCGTVTIDYSDFSGGYAYTFDSKTDEVIGIRDSSDTAFGVCDASYYFYGDFAPSCPDALTCYPCDDARNDANGAAGAAGAVGDTGAAGAAGDLGAGAGGAGVATPRVHCPNFADL